MLAKTTPHNLVKFVTWNCKGLNGTIKRCNILAHLKKLDMDICFLQETHLKNQDHNRLRNKWIGQIFHSNFGAKSRGTAILIKKTVPFIASKIIPDSQGRFIIVTGKLYDNLITLVNIYAPNVDDEQFINSLLLKIPDMDSHQLIIGGDFNLVLDSDLDRSSRRPVTETKMAKSVKKFMNTYKIIDPWRTLHPNTRQYSYYSPVHQTYTRIDYFLIDSKLLQQTKHCNYETLMLSDHSPLTLHLTFGYNQTSKIWRFDNSILSSKEGIEEIKKHINLYLSFNDTPDVTKSTLWEALKAFIRGQVISWKSLKNKQQREKETQLKKEITETDRQHSSSPSVTLHKKKLALQTELELVYTSRTVKMLTKARHRYYEQGERMGKILAQQIKKQTASRMITEIRTDSGQVTRDLQGINDTFKCFYKKLYTSESKKNPTLIDMFFDKMSIPTISLENLEQLEKPITKQEIEQVINSMQNSKAPGPDGYTSEFYKAFKEQISILLLDVFNEALHRGSLPPTFYHASISLIHKKDKDPLDPASYRPVSLLNVDNKILAKIVATRLETILPTIISQDQTGFIKNRQLFFNIRRLLNIIHTQDKKNLHPEILLSLDAEKAFDRVEWDYLFSTLSKFGFGPKIISLVKLLYAQPHASVRTNNMHSSYFPLSRSTRQGCPLSPLLFAIAIEPLALLLRATEEFIGIKRGKMEHKVSLYADDLLLYISNPVKSVPVIMEILKEFGAVSGYKLNLSKSVLFPINSKARMNTNVFNIFPFSISTEFKYLGINITQEYNGLFKHNFLKLYDQTKKDIESWKNLPLSLAGRINIIRMNVLPKFLFLFQCIPIWIAKAFFSKLDSLMSYFIWNGKTPRIKKMFLQRPTCQGGMGLPCFRRYYWSCNIRSMSFWLSTQGADWSRMESESCYPTSLKALLYSALPISKQKLENPVVSHSVKIWSQIRMHYGWRDASALSPLINNHTFPPSVLNMTFLQWEYKGIRCLKDLFIENIFPTFKQLQSKYSLENKDFFKYLQIRSFVKCLFPSFPNQPPNSAMETVFLSNPFQRGLIAKIHNVLSQEETTPTLDHLKRAWQDDLGVSITDNQWSKAQRNVHSTSVCIRHGLLQFKVLHRLHLSKLKLSKMFPSISPSCDRCSQGPASLAHMFWNCPHITTYWNTIFQTLSKILKKQLKPEPIWALFGVKPVNVQLSDTQNSMVGFVTLLARRLILLCWKQKMPPAHSALMKDIMGHLKLEKIKYLLRGKSEIFYSMWQTFIDYFGENV